MKESKAIRQLSKDIKEALAKLNYHWEIEHVRPVHNFTVVKFVDETHVEYDNCLSRDEFNQSVEDLSYVAPADIPKKYGCFVSTTGGFTRVTLERLQGSVTLVTVVGKHNFRPKDNFFKNLGFVKAVYKMVGVEIQPLLDQIKKEREEKLKATKVEQ